MVFSGDHLEIWGHRGWPTHFPDNSLAGIAAAGATCHGVEVDVRCTADGVLVLSHDPTFRGLEVATTTFSDLQQAAEAPHGLVRVGDVTRLLPTVKINWEIKNELGPGFDPTLGRRVANEVARLQDVITSFHWPTVDLVAGGSIATGLLFEQSGPSVEEAVRHATDGGHRSIAPHHSMVDEAMIQAAGSAGLDVTAWTVNDPADGIRLASLGVTTIISDDPGRLMTELGLSTTEEIT